MFIFTLTSRGWHRRGANNRVQSLECDTFEIQFSARRKITLAETRRSFLTLIVHNSGYAFRNCLLKQLMCRPATMAGISWLSSVHPLTSEILFFHGSTVIACLGLLCEFPRTHSDTPQAIALFRTSDQPAAETSTGQHTTLTTDTHPWPQRYSSPLSQQASGRRSTP